MTKLEQRLAKREVAEKLRRLPRSHTVTVTLPGRCWDLVEAEAEVLGIGLGDYISNMTRTAMRVNGVEE